MNDQQLDRYSRHLLLPQFDYDGQSRLLNATVLILGVGGLGSSAALYLASSGVGHLHLLDPDVVELSNLQRQVIHGEASIGKSKVASAADAIKRLNQDVTVTTHEALLEDDALLQLIKTVDVVLDCTDHSSTRITHNRLCIAAKVPLVSAAAIRFEGQLMVVDNKHAPQAACYQCVYPSHNNQEMTCSQSGILAPVVGMMGIYQALEAIKIISQVGESLVGTLSTFDGLTGTWQKFNVRKRADCPVCGQP